MQNVSDTDCILWCTVADEGTKCQTWLWWGSGHQRPHVLPQYQLAKTAEPRDTTTIQAESCQYTVFCTVSLYYLGPIAPTPVISVLNPLLTKIVMRHHQLAPNLW